MVIVMLVAFHHLKMNQSCMNVQIVINMFVVDVAVE